MNINFSWKFFFSFLVFYKLFTKLFNPKMSQRKRTFESDRESIVTMPYDIPSVLQIEPQNEQKSHIPVIREQTSLTDIINPQTTTFKLLGGTNNNNNSDNEPINDEFDAIRTPLDNQKSLSNINDNKAYTMKLMAQNISIDQDEAIQEIEESRSSNGGAINSPIAFKLNHTLDYTKSLKNVNKMNIKDQASEAYYDEQNDTITPLKKGIKNVAPKATQKRIRNQSKVSLSFDLDVNAEEIKNEDTIAELNMDNRDSLVAKKRATTRLALDELVEIKGRILGINNRNYNYTIQLIEVQPDPTKSPLSKHFIDVGMY